MKLVHRLLPTVLLGMAVLHAQAAPYFASKDGGMIWDQATGLVWARCSLGQKWNGKTCAGEARKHNFEAAQEAAKRFNAVGGLGGLTDWVVPKIRQLLTLRECSTGVTDREDLNDGNEAVHKKCSSGSVAPTVDPKAFPNTPVIPFWSSSHHDDSLAFCVDFDNGYISGSYRVDAWAVRLVRGSQLLGSEAALGFPVPLPAMTDADWKRAARGQKTSKNQSH